jgi:hypothetical protein
MFKNGYSFGAGKRLTPGTLQLTSKNTKAALTFAGAALVNQLKVII